MDQKKLILITGGNGLIGSSLIKKLGDQFNIISLDKTGNNFPLENAEIVGMDITNDQSVDLTLKRIKHAYGNKISSVIHLAAYYDFKGEPSDLYDEVTLKGTKRLLSKLRDFEVEQFVFSSSMLIYKPSQPGVKISEDWPLEPKWDYPISKVKAEKIIKENKGNIKSVILRMAGIYTDKTQSIPISNQIKRIYNQEITSRFFPGDINHGSSFLHLDDLIDVLILCIEKRKSLDDELILNIGESETLSYFNIQNIISYNIYGTPWKTYYIPPFMAKFGAWLQNIFGNPFIKPWMIDMADDHFELDISKARQTLNWFPKNSLKKSIPKMISLLANNPEEWYKINKMKVPDNFPDFDKQWLEKSLESIKPKKKEAETVEV